MIKIILLLGLAVTITYFIRRLPGESDVAVSAIQWNQTAWKLYIDHQWIDAELIDAVIWTDWLFLSFKCAGKYQLTHLMLCRHHFDTEHEWRHLRRYLNN